MNDEKITEILANLSPIMLPDMSAFKFMDRTDTKFLLPVKRLPELLNIMDRRYSVLEINNTRALPYSSLYFDNSDHLLYYQHIRKRAERFKLRYRTYESSGDTFLEIKKKTMGSRTTKWRIPACDYAGRFDRDALSFLEKNFPLTAHSLNPSLMNKFTRITLAGIETSERITIDFNISFSDPIMGTIAGLPYLAVIELKREGHAANSPFYTMLKSLDSYSSSFSKYVIGLAVLKEKFRKNSAKLKFLQIKRMEEKFL
jgi:hypothetical protein